MDFFGDYANDTHDFCSEDREETRYFSAERKAP